MLSDDSTSDSDTGIRFKTDSTRTPVSSENRNLNKSDKRDRNDRSFDDRRTDSHSATRRDRRDRSGDRSPVRDRHSRDRKSRSVRSNERNGSSRKKNDRRSDERNDRYSRRSKNDKTENHSDSRRSGNGEKHSSIRSTIDRHLRAAKDDKRHSNDERHLLNKNDPHRAVSIAKIKSDTDGRLDLLIDRNEKNVVKTQECEPISYYNMINDKSHAEIVEDAIPVSDSSLDENTLREQALMLKQELKSTKRKSRHKDKKRCHRKKINKPNDDMVKLITEPKSNSVQKLSDESNEEGEIVSDSDEKTRNNSNSNNSQMPDLRDRLSLKSKSESVFGPELPPKQDKEDADKAEGPALPPHLVKQSEINMGPCIPDDVRKKLSDQPANLTYDSDSDEDHFGPLPEGSESKWTKAHKSLEERALKMKINAIDSAGIKESEVDAREEWMLKLPDSKVAHLGLTSRQFRAREGPDLSDRSSWTDTPDIKAKKASGLVIEDEKEDSKKLLRDADNQFIRERDEDQEDAVRKYKKKNKRDSSLLEIHEKKMKKKKKKSEKEKCDKPIRRPFSRDSDLKVNRFDEAQKKAILKKAQLLDTRFSKGESKYL